MNVLFLGNSLPPQILTTFANDSKGRGSLSQHNYERSVMKGLSQQEGINVKAVLVPWVGTYPISYKHLFTRHEEFDVNGMPVRSIAFCNLAIINGWSRRHRLVKELLRSFNEFEGDTVHVYIVTYKYDILVALNEAKRRTKKHITQVVNMIDMPGFAFESRRGISNWRKKQLRNRLETTMTLVKKSDGVVIMTRFFMDFFDNPIPNVVVEGMVDVDGMQAVTPLRERIIPEKKIVVYTGTLMKVYGVLNLVDAFEKMDFKDSELWICGTGEAAVDIMERSRKNPRIKYLGLLSNTDSWQLQRNATVLVNPRTSDGLFTKYSFPSKNLEYLLSGRPVVFNRLPGIPNEYFNYAFAPKDDSVDSLAICLKKVLDMTDCERNEIGKKGKAFVMMNKNAKTQVKKIVELLNTL